MVFEYVINFFRSEKMGPQQALFSFFSLSSPKIKHIKSYMYTDVHMYTIITSRKAGGTVLVWERKKKGGGWGGGEPQRQAAAACGR